uniref:Uncharacterized protein n=1 Tax=Streptomyces sp. NBC_00003 TaxID=2903608 RepID=A0AAU2V8Z4_9ACTN
MISAAVAISSEIRLFRGDQVLCIDTASGNKVTYNGQTTKHGTFAQVPPKFANGIDGAHFIGNDLRLFRGGRLVIVDVSQANKVTYNGTVTGHGTYAQVPADFAQDIDDVINIGGEVRLFKGDRMVIVDYTQGNKISYDGPITKHGTFAQLPAGFSGDFDAVHTIGNDIRIFKGERLVIVDYTQGNKVTYDGPIIKHGTYINVPANWVS